VDAVHGALGHLPLANRLLFHGFRPGPPVIVVPGLMATALEVTRSETCPQWQNKRVWFDLFKMLPSLSGGALGGFSGRGQRKWLEHLLLSEDGCSDPPGCAVRPVQGRDSQGLEGVEFLMKGTSAMLNKSTYVFGPLIAQLRQFGYSGSTLAACPYDWRLPPAEMEARDKTFSRLATAIQAMYVYSNLLFACPPLHFTHDHPCILYCPLAIPAFLPGTPTCTCTRTQNVKLNLTTPSSLPCFLEVIFHFFINLLGINKQV